MQGGIFNVVYVGYGGLCVLLLKCCRWKSLFR